MYWILIQARLLTAPFFVHETLSPYKSLEELWDGEIWYFNWSNCFVNNRRLLSACWTWHFIYKNDASQISYNHICCYFELLYYSKKLLIRLYNSQYIVIISNRKCDACSWLLLTYQSNPYVIWYGNSARLSKLEIERATKLLFWDVDVDDRHLIWPTWTHTTCKFLIYSSWKFSRNRKKML